MCNTIEQLTTDLIGYNIDLAVISESHLKQKHSDSCVSIDGYHLFRRDRLRRKGGGVAIYIRHSFKATVWTSQALMDPLIELLWVKVVREHDVTFVSAPYHPPASLRIH